MKIQKEIVTLIDAVINVAKLVNINNVIIDEESVRGKSEDNQVLVLQPLNVELPFADIGLSRIDTLSSRLNLVKGTDFSTQAILDDGSVVSLSFKNKSASVDYRCQRASKIQCPRGHTDTMVYQVPFSQEDVNFLAKAQAAMNTDVVTIVIQEGNAFFQLNDLNDDVLNYHFSDSVRELVESSFDKVQHRYNIKSILPLLKGNTSAYFTVGQRGFFEIKVPIQTEILKELNMCVVPVL